MKRELLVIAVVAGIALAACATLSVMPTPTIPGDAAEEAEVRGLAASFAKRLQDVSLLAPDAAQEMQKQYSELVSPTLLESWMKDISIAPGRHVSSPWPDRIEIATITKEGSDRYVITGWLDEITSAELVNGGATARIPVRIVVQRIHGQWFITDYSEER
jgi:hypothetical protein